MAPHLSTLRVLSACCSKYFLNVLSYDFSTDNLEKEAPPTRADMRSVHAGACFMKVGLFGKKSSLERHRETISEILAPFWSPLGTLCALLRPLRPTFCRTVFPLRFFAILVENGCPQETVCGKGGATCGLQGIMHSGRWTMLLPCVYEHSARRVPAQPRGEVTFSDFSLLVSLQEPFRLMYRELVEETTWNKTWPDTPASVREMRAPRRI